MDNEIQGDESKKNMEDHENVSKIKTLVKVDNPEESEDKESTDKINNLNLPPAQKAQITKAVTQFKKEAWDLLAKTEESFSKISELEKSSIEIKKVIDEKFKNIENIETNVNDKNKEVSEIYSRIFQSTDDKQSIKDEILTSEEEIKKSAESLSQKRKELDEYYDKIFGTKDEQGNITGGLKKEIEEKKAELIEIQKKETERYDALFKKIEGLLPGATSTGLAKTFADQKKDYKWPNIGWSTLFIITMISMAIFGVFTLKDIVGSDELNLQLALSKILARTPFFIAVIWLGYFSSKQQSQNKRLEQEYAHKENVSRSYEGFKKQASELEQTKENKELSLKLLENVIGSVGFNPSKTLDNDSHREESPLIDKAISFFTGGKKKENSNSSEKEE